MAELTFYVVHDPAGPTYALTKAADEDTAKQNYIEQFMLEPEDIDRLGPITVKTWEQYMKDVVNEARHRMRVHFTGLRDDCHEYTVEMDEYIGPAL